MYSLDLKLAAALHAWGHRRPGLWRFLAHYPVYVFLSAILAMAGPMPRTAWFVDLALPALGCYVITFLLQSIIRRQRPATAKEYLQLLLKTYSFPSAHAASGFAFATLLTVAAATTTPQYVVFAPLFYIVAMLMSLARVVVGVHYPSDIVAGGVLGIILAILLRNLV